MHEPQESSDAVALLHVNTAMQGQRGLLL
jgi:hypothetical protein